MLITHKGFFESFRPQERLGPIKGSSGNTALLCVGLAIIYIVVGRLSIALTVQDGNIDSGAYFPEGVSLFFAIIFGIRVWPGVFFGQLLLSVIWSDIPFSSCTLIALVNSLENCLGGYLFWRWGISPQLQTPWDVAKLLALSALILQPLSAIGGLLALLVSGQTTLEAVLSWWASNTLGQFLLATTLLTWFSTTFRSEKSEIPHALVIVTGYLMLILLFVVGDTGHNDSLIQLVFFAAYYLVLIWLAIQCSVRTIALTNLLMSVGFLWMIRNGPELNLAITTKDQLLYADIFILGGVFTALIVASLLEQVTERKLELRRANAAKERLIYIIGHDLTAPVANLKTSLDLLINGTFSPAEFREIQGELRQSVNHAHQTLMNLMEWGSFQMDSRPPRPTEVELRACATEAVNILAPMAEGKKITVENMIPERARVLADKDQVESVLRNLLSNALKFTPPGGRVTLSAQPENGVWRTSVEDNGIGIAPERTARLFNQETEYYSTPGTAQERGLGLGLHICLDFIRANKGSLSVYSKLGYGTTFDFTLPAHSNTSPHTS